MRPNITKPEQVSFSIHESGKESRAGPLTLLWDITLILPFQDSDDASANGGQVVVEERELPQGSGETTIHFKKIKAQHSATGSIPVYKGIVL